MHKNRIEPILYNHMGEEDFEMKEVEISTNVSDAFLNCASKSDLVFEISEKT